MGPSEVTPPPSVIPAGDILAAVEAERQWMIITLCELIARPTELGREEAGQVIVDQMFRELGLSTRSVFLDPDRLANHPRAAPFDWDVGRKRNVVGEWVPSAASGGRSLILSGHIDVPPAPAKELWGGDPYDAEIRGDRLIGWGCLKAGLVAMLGALRGLRRLGFKPGARIQIQSVVEEESGGNGALAAILDDDHFDAAIVASCVGDTVPTSQVGVLWFSVEVLAGRTQCPGGAALESLTAKAFEVARVARRAVERLTEEVPKEYAAIEDPVGFKSGTITAGSVPSVRPMSCRIGCRAALFPGQRISEVRREIDAAVAGHESTDADLGKCTFRVQYLGFSTEGYSIPHDADIVSAAVRAHELRSGRSPAVAALAAASDARTFVHAGLPATCMGPPVKRLHECKEQILISELVTSAQSIALLVQNWTR